MAKSSNENEKITFITSNKGQRLLVLDDHVYRCNKKTTRKKYWICMISGCSITVHTDENDVYLCGGKTYHEHDSSTDFIKTINLRHRMKERALKELAPINVIYEEEISKASPDISVLALFPTSQEIYSTISKARRRVLPALPQSCIFNIPDQFKLTADGNRFLLVDEAPVRRERLLIFASDRQLDLLFEAETIYMDGTFSKAPPYFTQIYIIHAVNYDICLPCVFALMVNKKGATYRKIFFELKQIANERQKHFSPKMIVTDFESGILPVVKTEFVLAKNYGCYFHYTKALFKKIKELGLQKEYHENERTRSFCKKLMALAMMPIDTVSSVYEEIRRNISSINDPAMERLLIYFEKNWMSDIHLWNVSTCDYRTNNFCEGYHNRMNNRINRSHPNIWRFIQFMQAEEKRFETLLGQWSTGASKRKDARITVKERRISTLYERYHARVIDAPELLVSLSYHVGSNGK